MHHSCKRCGILKADDFVELCAPGRPTQKFQFADTQRINGVPKQSQFHLAGSFRHAQRVSNIEVKPGFCAYPRQGAPGIVSAILLAFGRGIGDAASVLFTAGYTDNLPSSLLRPVASLPLAVFFQLATPFPVVQQRAYASALVLTVMVLVVCVLSRLASGRLSRYVVK